MWRLYFNNVEGANKAFPLTSYHRVGFYGSQWSSLYYNNPSKFTALFTAITSKALNVKPEDIKITNISFHDGVVLGLHV